MRKNVTKVVSSTEEVSLEFAVDEFLDKYWSSEYPDEFFEYLDDYFGEFETITDKEKEALTNEIKKESNRRILEIRNIEEKKLKTRKAILDFLKSITYDTYEGEIGYLLSAEEILDLILENGNK